MIDYSKMLEVAACTRSFIQTSNDQAQALRDILSAYEVVFGIFPGEKNEWDLHVIKGRDLVVKAEKPYHHTVLPFQTREQAATLEALVAPAS